MGKGYVLINRQIEDNWIWNDRPFSKGQAWIDLILMANYKDKTVIIKGKVIEVKRGQLLRSIDYLVERWGWSRKKVRSFLTSTLEIQKMVTVEGTHQGMLITIEKYELYQTLGHESGTLEGTVQGTLREHIQYNDNKYKDNKDNNSRRRGPSLDDVKNYVKEHDYKMDPQEFFDYYQEVGWTKKNGQAIRDWRASVRSWERRSKEWAAKEGAGKGPKYTPYKHQEYKREPMPDYLREKISRKRGGK